MFKTTTTYYVEPTDYLDKVFKNKILPSGFINKGRCGIGGTQMEICNKQRSSIIVVPNISIIISKKAQHPQLNVVYGEISREEVYNYLKLTTGNQKIITTPEGVRKIMWAAEQSKRTDEILNQWFLMLDESHTFISESYRDDILAPFDFFWDFSNKCIISATPYYFTDPRMKELDYYEVKLTKKLGDVTLVNSISVGATLKYLLDNASDFPGNIHIFLNSVTEISKAIEKAQLKDCSIFCANDKDNKNMVKLGDLIEFYHEHPSEVSFKKINFYTCKYFEGWDMYDTDATLVLVTDVHKEHTKIGICDKGIQAFGRLRGRRGRNEGPAPYQMIHITNSLFNDAMKPLDAIIEEFTYDATILIKQNNEYVTDPKVKSPKRDDRLNKFADISETSIAILNSMKLDQQINKASSNEIYNNVKFIQDAWSAQYGVEKQDSRLTLETITVSKRKSAVQQFKEDYSNLLIYKHKRVNNVVNWDFSDSIDQSIKRTNPLAYKAAYLLDEAQVQGMKFSPTKIAEVLIYKENELSEVKLLKLLNRHFKVGHFYENIVIKSKMQELYNELVIKNKNGKIKVASPSQLGDIGRFEIKADKKQDSNGKWVHGFKILRKQFSLSVAA